MGIQQHPDFGSLKTLVQSLIKKIGVAQAEYFIRHEKYFQGQRIPSGQLDGSAEAEVPIPYGLHPDDQSDSWGSFAPQNFNDAAKLPIHIKLDVYQCSQGWGWILVCELFKDGLGPDKYGTDGSHWVYQHNEGPEADSRSGVWDDWFIQPDGI